MTLKPCHVVLRTKAQQIGEAVIFAVVWDVIGGDVRGAKSVLLRGGADDPTADDSL